MIGRSLPEYLFIRVCICGLRLVTPISITYVLASGFALARGHAQSRLYSPLLAVYALAETAFYLLVYLPRGRRLQKVSMFNALPLIFCLSASCVNAIRITIAVI